MSERYIKEVVVTDPRKFKVVLDNGDTLGGVKEVDLVNPIVPDNVTTVSLSVYVGFSDG